MGINRVNLANYEIVSSYRDMGNEGLVITPKDNSPQMFFKRVVNKALVVDVDAVEWTRHTKISTVGSKEDYNYRVNWWFDNMSIELYDDFEREFGQHVDIQSILKEERRWLLSCSQGKRKDNILGFLYRNFKNKAEGVAAIKDDLYNK